MIKKRLYLIIALAVAFIALLCVYFFAIAPMLETEDPADERQPLLEGEAYASAKTILMFDQVERGNIKSIEVHNKKASYKFYYNEQKKDFFVENYEKAPYSKEMISALVTNAGYPVTMTRVADHADNLSEYGLAPEDDPAYYVLTTRDNKTHKVYIGNMIPTGAGYYTKYDARDAVYITEASISQTLLGTVENLLTPMLFIPVSQSNYFLVKDFILIKNSEPFVRITSETKPAKDDDGKEFEEFVKYSMDFPAEYDVSNNYDNLLQSFMEFYGNAVVYLGNDNDIIADDILEKYNLKAPAYELLFTHNGVKNDILISSKAENGVYYAYSLLFNLICEFPADLFDFLEWELMDYVNKPLLQYNINDIESISISSKDFEETFILYTSTGETTTNPVTGATTTATNLDVKVKSTGKYLENSKNFRQFYMGILTTNLVTYADVKDETGLDCLATIRIITRQGKKIEYAFYPYSTRRCFYTLNGKGEFYVLTDAVDKIVSDAKKLLTGEEISYQDKH